MDQSRICIWEKTIPPLEFSVGWKGQAPGTSSEVRFHQHPTKDVFFFDKRIPPLCIPKHSKSVFTVQVSGALKATASSIITSGTRPAPLALGCASALHPASPWTPGEEALLLPNKCDRQQRDNYRTFAMTVDFFDKSTKVLPLSQRLFFTTKHQSKGERK
jgi:hypothetical protein